MWKVWLQAQWVSTGAFDGSAISPGFSCGHPASARSGLGFTGCHARHAHQADLYVSLAATPAMDRDPFYMHTGDALLGFRTFAATD